MMRHQMYLMSSGFSRTSLIWPMRSRTVGFSCACFLLPAVAGNINVVFRAYWVLQAAVAFLSDYLWSGVSHWSHGADRWLSLAMVSATVALGTSRLGCAIIPCAAVPLYCLFRSKSALFWAEYEMWHTLWHVTGGIISAAVLSIKTSA